MGVTYSQFFPPKPSLTAANLPSQKGKVFIVTGGASGVGFELCKILYQAGGKVYLAGRSPHGARLAATRIKSTVCDDPGELAFLFLDLQDVGTIRPAVEAFTAAESRLDVLFNNAGVFQPPQGSVSAQGHELQMATNCLGPHLLAQLLTPTLINTAQSSPSAAVRIVWTSSLLVDMSAPRGGGITSNTLSTLVVTDPSTNYTTSKTGNWYLAKAFSDRLRKHVIVSVTQNPGNLATQSLRHLHWIMPYLTAPLNHDPVFGAYTELYAGLSRDLNIDDGGSYIIPWGRKHPCPRADIVDAMKREDDGGPDAVKLFVDWCDKLTKRFH
ncbi:hypothetical protein M409DRAFT_62401 [Zasmidium cellare ATCC 36951]|uniref:Short-chain dehydrogenase n=1 Tax=Zasmidium cellare ATCC 36951 TaxID=1080233 RepID=A0A6A6CZI3_ZASCE|nr:uncharacterized protein M409DRAFT_62401 [Zasmidium cellare ATCC 36951]KAF2172647.1 hypothetical protein M409DRAFT_62401 [Zasmidium cellare ATCC 36951]